MSFPLFKHRGFPCKKNVTHFRLHFYSLALFSHHQAPTFRWCVNVMVAIQCLNIYIYIYIYIYKERERESSFFFLSWQTVNFHFGPYFFGVPMLVPQN